MDAKPIWFKIVPHFYRPETKETPRNPGISGSFYGASDLTRTGDLLITSEMHYRLCYTSSNYQYLILISGGNVNRDVNPARGERRKRTGREFPACSQ